MSCQSVSRNVRTAEPSAGHHGGWPPARTGVAANDGHAAASGRAGQPRAVESGAASGRCGRGQEPGTTSIVAVIVWLAPGASVTACTLSLPVSTHTIAGYSSSPKSGIAFALSTQGFQTTVALERLLRTTIRRCAPG